MEKHTAGEIHPARSSQSPALFLLSACFLLGALAGCLLAGRAEEEGNLVLANYLEQYLQLAVEDTAGTPGALQIAQSTFIWPLVILLLGATVPGLIGLPAVFLVRGFLLTFAAASFFCLWGLSGLILACAAFGLTGILEIPALFVLGTQCFSCSYRMLGRLTGRSLRSSPAPIFLFPRILFTAGSLCACFFLEYTTVPILLASAAKLVL